ncbi:MAG: hypothetical protein BEN19_08320 [Epulopiscium sp. Nuni2H_MBin003]|nr:MAG: hypothetical protein BEN19_08320 [Epulopiscium sp. Nuni2H_MBin003]
MKIFNGNKSTKAQFVTLFMQSMLITTLCAGTTVAFGVWSYQKHIYVPAQGDVIVKHEEVVYYPQEEGESIILGEVIVDDEVNQTIAVFGTDAGGHLTDVIMVVNFDSSTNKLKVISIPRDSKVYWTQAQQDAMKEAKRYSVDVSKINEMTGYVGIDNIRDFTVRQIELILGLKVDNYVVVSTSAFREIVDTVGGIELYVPQNMYYTDPAQGLYINFKEGLQVLDGKTAEHFVRYRSYWNGDLGRIEMQQVFIEAFVDTLLSPSTVTKIPEMTSILFSSVKTDATITQVLEYYDYLLAFDADNIEFYTVPGEVSNGSPSYFLLDLENMTNFINEIFFE